MTTQQERFDKLHAEGLAERGDIFGETAPHEGADSLGAFTPSRLPACPPLPEPGIYFGMPDEVYHALPALSNTGVKKLAASSMIFWASTPWLSEKKRRQNEEARKTEKVHHRLGKAYHCRILEGAEEFNRRYAVALDASDYPNALESTDQIKAAIGQFEYPKEQKRTIEEEAMVPVKPISTVPTEGGGERNAAKDDWIEQLRGLGWADEIPKTVTEIKAAIGKYEEPGMVKREITETVMVPVKPHSKVKDTMPGGDEYMRAAVKADWIAQLLELDPEAEIFGNIEADYAREHAGKTFITPDEYGEIEIAAAMVERDPELKDAFRGGFPEVTLIWYCPRTGVPMKARMDYMKTKLIPDLKSVSNQRERSIENAIRFEIAAYKYNIQPCVYFEGAQVVRQLVREQGARAIGVHPAIDDETRSKMVVFAMNWAKHMKPDEWLWVFQQKGDAPITRGAWFPRGGTTKMVTDEIINAAKKRFRQCSEHFGTEPWLDVAPTYLIADEDIPQSATEI